MLNFSNQFVYSSNVTSLSFIIITLVINILFFLVNLFIQSRFNKLKWLSPSKLTIFACILGLIIGIIFCSFNNFELLTINQLKNNIWIWNAVSFVYAFGSLFITIAFLACWLIIPLICFRMVKRFLVDKDKYIDEFKKLLIILFIVLVVVGFSNLGWVFPLNDTNTPLTIFSEHNNYIIHDQWYSANKFMFDHCFLTKWYPWAFIGYFILNVAISFIVIRLKIKDEEFIVRCEQKLSKAANFLHILDSSGPITGFSFICCYFLFNWKYMLLHILYIFIVLLCSYILISIVLIIVNFIIERKNKNKYAEMFDLLKINFSFKKVDKEKLNKINKTNVCDVSVVALVLTIYLGFANNFDFEASMSTNAIIFNNKMHSFDFWFQVILSAIVFNLFVSNKPFNKGFAKLVVAEATYSVTPGMQTSIFNWIDGLTKPFNNFINCLAYKIIANHNYLHKI